MNILTYFPREECYGQLGKISFLCVWSHLEHSMSNQEVWRGIGSVRSHLEHSMSNQEVWRGLGSMWWHLEHSIEARRCGEDLGVCGRT